MRHGLHRQVGVRACFNPRTPCGVRPVYSRVPSPVPLFQSTHSLRSATEADIKIRAYIDSFNPRTPCGVRPCESSHCNHATGFNPRTPCGVRPAPLVRMTQTPQFQSTHSLRSATARRAFNISDDAVSIHALLAECDFVFFWNCKCST